MMLDTPPTPDSDTNASLRAPVQPVTLRRSRPRGLYDLTLAELETRVADLGHPAYRARQIWNWAYRQLARDFAAMRNVPAALRDELQSAVPMVALEPVRTVTADDGETINPGSPSTPHMRVLATGEMALTTMLCAAPSAASTLTIPTAAIFAAA